MTGASYRHFVNINIANVVACSHQFCEHATTYTKTKQNLPFS